MPLTATVTGFGSFTATVDGQQAVLDASVHDQSAFLALMSAQGQKGDPGETGVVDAVAPIIYDSVLKRISIDPEYKPNPFDQSLNKADNAQFGGLLTLSNGTEIAIISSVAGLYFNTGGMLYQPGLITFPDSTEQTTAYPGPPDLSGYLQLTGGTMSGNIAWSPGGQYIGVGADDFGIGGYAGLSLVCSVGYDLNWQAGWLTAYEQDRVTPRPLYLNSGYGSPLRSWDYGTDSGVEVSHTGITFADNTTQTTAATPFDPTGYATESWVTSQGYLVSGDLAGYATQSYVTSQGYITSSALTPYLLSSTASSTYAPIARGLPSGGTTSQALVKTSNSDYAAGWTTLDLGDRYATTSTTSLTISNGTKTLTVGTGLAYTTQQSIVIAYNASNHMHGTVTSYNSGTGSLVVGVTQKTGSGTYSAWTVNVGGINSLPAWGDITGTLSSQTDLQGALDAKLAVTTAAATYYLQTNPAGYITSAALAPYLLSSTAASTYQTISGMSSYLTTSAAASTYLTQTNAASTYAPLASPALTGNPTAPTQGAGNNSTRIATTAFVQQEVPAASTSAAGKVQLATLAESIVGTSTNKVLTAEASMWQLCAYGAKHSLAVSTSSATGTGAAAGTNNEYGIVVTCPNVGLTGNALRIFGPGTQSPINRGGGGSNVRWDKPILITGSFLITSNLDTLNVFRLTIGKPPTGFTVGNLTVAGFGLRFSGGGLLYLDVHNGSSLTSVSTGITIPAASGSNVARDFALYSDGNGNVKLYIDDALVASSSAGPTGLGTFYNSAIIAEIESTGVTTVGNGRVATGSISAYFGR